MRPGARVGRGPRNPDVTCGRGPGRARSRPSCVGLRRGGPGATGHGRALPAPRTLLPADARTVWRFFKRHPRTEFTFSFWQVNPSSLEHRRWSRSSRFLFSFFNEKCYFQATCNSGLYKPVFHPFLDLAREREKCSQLCFSKSSYCWFFFFLFVCFLFLLGKTDPVLILTKCVLHMCGASVSAAGPSRRGGLRHLLMGPCRAQFPGPAWPAVACGDSCRLCQAGRTSGLGILCPARPPPVVPADPPPPAGVGRPGSCPAGEGHGVIKQ